VRGQYTTSAALRASRRLLSGCERGRTLLQTDRSWSDRLLPKELPENAHVTRRADGLLHVEGWHVAQETCGATTRWRRVGKSRVVVDESDITLHSARVTRRARALSPPFSSPILPGRMH